MDKMNRYIDEKRMNQSKEQSINVVLNTITPKRRTSIFSRTRLVLTSTFIIATMLVVMITSQNAPSPNPITISAYESETIAEVTYLTTTLISSNFVVGDMNTIFLSNQVYLADESTEFEQNQEEINHYFDTLKVFLEEELFSDSVETIPLEEDPNSFTISFDTTDNIYVLKITFDENNFSGTLEVDTIIYDVLGTLEETENELKFMFEASKNQSHIRIEYKTENKENELEHKYEITQNIDNVEYYKEIKVTREQNEYKVEIKEGQDEYELKKELEDGIFKYKLKYSLQGTQGEATIIESIDSDGTVNYQYRITEGSIEKEINKGKPNSDKENPGNSGNSNGNNNPGKRTQNIIKEKSKLIYT